MKQGNQRDCGVFAVDEFDPKTCVHVAMKSRQGGTTMFDHDTFVELQKHPFCAGMKETHLKKLTEIALRNSVYPGQYLCREKEVAHSFFLIQSGRVAIESHPSPGKPSTLIQTLGGGEVVGWSWLLPPHHWQFDARVLDSAQLITIDGALLRARCEEDHEFGYEILQRLISVIVARLAAARRSKMA